jgi:hypothetical protein
MIWFIILLITGIGWLVTMASNRVSNIADYARRAGFSGDDLPVAVAIALAESGGNPNAYNPETAAGTPTGKGSYGLWQIYLKAHPEFAGQNLFDPQTNANAAFAVYLAAGRSFSSWTTFNLGRYVAFLDDAIKQVNA